MSDTKKKKEKGGPKRKSYVRRIAKEGVSQDSLLLHHPGADYTKQGDAQDFEIAPDMFTYQGVKYSLKAKGETSPTKQTGADPSKPAPPAKPGQTQAGGKVVKPKKKDPNAPDTWLTYYDAAIRAGYKFARDARGELFDLRQGRGTVPGKHSF
tara:strand:+ start:86 stop:544 length:459 start_codon:yes stop_codon:yes gene_type:complete